ncbi:MAG TPA: hypothetical protein VMF91_13665, partial [Bryobacteraceae bacterium]|nr:hypothetical protein [Bryobacteraceae bacterium]
EAIYLTNDAGWWANTIRPDLLHQALWAVAQEGDPVAKALDARGRSSYSVREKIQVQGAPALEIYERTDAGAEK